MADCAGACPPRARAIAFVVGKRNLRGPVGRQSARCRLRLLHELRFQIHRADAVDLAGDVVAIARLGQADVPDLGAALDDR